MEEEIIKVLLVEDSPSDVMLLDRQLREVARPLFVLRPVGRLSAVEAALREEKFDVVLLDLTLPDSFGLETVKRTLELVGDTPVVVMTGMDDGELALRAVRQGAQDFLTKGQDDANVVARALRHAIERRRADRALYESEEKFRILTESIRDGFWICSPDVNRIDYASPAFESIWGFKASDTDNNPGLLVGAIHPDDHQAALEAMRDSSGAPWDLEFRIVRRDKKIRWIRDRGYPVKDAQGNTLRYANISTDITQQRDLESKLRQSQKMEAIGQLAGGVAHDFNNLLQAIIGHAQIAIMETEDGSRLHNDLEQILKASDKASNLTRQLLTFGRRQLLRPAVIDLNDVVHDLLRMLQRLIREDVTLRFSGQSNLGCIKADVTQIEQVIVNLVVNARDALPSGGEILIETRRETVVPGVDFPLDEAGVEAPASALDYVTLTVNDNGMGIPPEIMEKIFDPFFTTKMDSGGTGLGLATVYGVVQQHGGFVRVDSQPGKGSMFKVYLPRSEARKEESAPALQAAPGATHNETILIAEDDEQVRDLSQRVLRNAGYCVLAAANGEAAVALFEANAQTIDAVILDAIMPRLNGHAVYERINAMRPGVRVLFASGYSSTLLQPGFLEEEGLELVAKPFTPSTLLRALRKTLDAPERLRRAPSHSAVE